MSVKAVFTNLADKFREALETEDKFSLTKMAESVPLVYLAGEEKHLSRYHVETKIGSGISEIQFNCPFKPDAILIYTWSPYYYTKAGTISMATADFRSFGQHGGMMRYRTDSSLTQSNFKNQTLQNSFIYSDGSFRLVKPSAFPNVVFDTAMKFVFVAVKYTDKSDAELLLEEILRIPSGYTEITLSQKRVFEAVSEEEWAEMIAGFPNITFNLI